jgi:hypothetical protein
MRSANKKHGNIGDIELLNGKIIIESWDAKYNKSYLRDELDEICDKIQIHPELRIVGFVCSHTPERTAEIQARIDDITEQTGVHVCILTVDEWFERFSTLWGESSRLQFEIVKCWHVAYIESLCQMRRDIAPIDEPCEQWVRAYIDMMTMATESG